MMHKIFTIGVVFLAGCSTSAAKQATFNHAQYGQVSTSHPAFVQTRKMCAQNVYSSGVTLDGVTYYTREAAMEARFSKMLADAGSFGGGYAGIQGALAVSSGNMDHINNKTDQQSPTFDSDPSFAQAEQQFEQCLTKNGFVRQ